MAENIMRALSRYVPDLLLLLALYLLLLRRWVQQGGRRVFVVIPDALPGMLPV